MRLGLQLLSDSVSYLCLRTSGATYSRVMRLVKSTPRSSCFRENIGQLVLKRLVSDERVIMVARNTRVLTAWPSPA